MQPEAITHTGGDQIKEPNLDDLILTTPIAEQGPTAYYSESNESGFIKAHEDQVTYPIRDDITPQNGTRNTGINRAWKLERELVIATGQGTRDWTPAQIEELISEGSVTGFTGHHINNVADFEEWAGDPRNIRFLSTTPRGGEHLNSLQGHNNDPNSSTGSYQNPTNGRLIDREAMIKLLKK